MNKIDSGRPGIFRSVTTQTNKRRWYHVLTERLPEKGLRRADLVRQIAARANVAESTVYSWLNGTREVTPEELKLIALEAGFMVGELLQEDAYYARSPTERSLLDQFRTLSEEEQAFLIKLIKQREKTPVA